MPPLIRYIYDHNCSLAKRDNYDLVLITKKNVKDYLKYIPNYFYNLEANYQSDVVRFYALNQYGGIWLDSDAIILKDLNEFFNKFNQTDRDMMLSMDTSEYIGCAFVMAKRNTLCTNFSIRYFSSKDIRYKIFIYEIFFSFFIYRFIYKMIRKNVL